MKRKNFNRLVDLLVIFIGRFTWNSESVNIELNCCRFILRIWWSRFVVFRRLISNFWSRLTTILLLKTIKYLIELVLIHSRFFRSILSSWSLHTIHVYFLKKLHWIDPVSFWFFITSGFSFTFSLFRALKTIHNNINFQKISFWIVFDSFLIIFNRSLPNLYQWMLHSAITCHQWNFNIKRQSVTNRHFWLVKSKAERPDVNWSDLNTSITF